MAITRSVTTSGPPRISGPTPTPSGGSGAAPMPGAMHATIGHVVDDHGLPDETIAYWFLRGGQAYVECTLQAKIVGGGTVAPAIAYRAALATVDPSTQTDFYCQDVIVGWDAARGFEFQIKATNYLDARWSIEAVNGP